MNRITRGDEDKQLEPKAMDVLAYVVSSRDGSLTRGRTTVPERLSTTPSTVFSEQSSTLNVEARC